MDVCSIDCTNSLVRLHPLGQVDPSEVLGGATHELLAKGFQARMADDRLVLPYTRTQGVGTSIVTEEDGSLDYIELCIGGLDRRAAAELGSNLARAYDEHLLRLGPWRAHATVIATAALRGASAGSVFQAGTMTLAAAPPQIGRRLQFEWHDDENRFLFLLQTQRDDVSAVAEAMEFLFGCRDNLLNDVLSAFLVWIEQVLDLEWPERIEMIEQEIEAPLEV